MTTREIFKNRKRPRRSLQQIPPSWRPLAGVPGLKINERLLSFLRIYEIELLPLPADPVAARFGGAAVAAPFGGRPRPFFWAPFSFLAGDAGAAFSLAGAGAAAFSLAGDAGAFSAFFGAATAAA